MFVVFNILDVLVEEEGVLSEDGVWLDEIVIEIKDEFGEYYYVLQGELEYQYVDENNDIIVGYYSVWLEFNDFIFFYVEVDCRGVLICLDGVFNGNIYCFVIYIWEDLLIGFMLGSKLWIWVMSLLWDVFLYYCFLD